MSRLNSFLMRGVELKLVPVVADLEDKGYKIDRPHFERIRKQLIPERDEVLGRIRREIGSEFNPSSPDQLRDYLYGHLQLPITHRTKEGLPSTDKLVLQRAARLSPVVLDIIRFRDVNRILGTYCKFPELVGDDGRLHAEFGQAEAVTGRFSAFSAIQAIPKDDEFRIRHGFVAEKGFQIVSGDVHQQELRVLAQGSGDKNLQAAILNGVDLHGWAAVKVFKLPCKPGDVKSQFPEQRDRVKAVQFGIVYGASAFSLADTLQIEQRKAQELITGYFAQFPSVKQFIEDAHKRVLRDGYIDDVFGRRRYFPGVEQLLPPGKTWKDFTEKERKLASTIGAAKRKAQNFLVQGPSATITKLAMLRCHEHIMAEHPEIKMILTLHDDLQFEVPNALVAHFAEELPGLMCNLGLERFGFSVPMQVEVKVGPSWGELQNWKGAKSVASKIRKQRR